MKLHEFCQKLPMMPTEELEALSEDIRQNGLLIPILTWQGEIIDGRHRYLACQRAGVEPRFEEWKREDKSLIGLILSLNVRRRQLTSSQKAALAVEALPFYEAEAAERLAAGQKRGGEIAGSGRPNSSSQKVDSSKNPYSDNANKAIAQAAKDAGTNRTYVSQAKDMKRDDPERFERMKQGKENVSRYRRKQTCDAGRRPLARAGTAAKLEKVRRTRQKREEAMSIIEETHGAILNLAAENRALTVTEIARIAGRELGGVDKLLTRIRLVPWCGIDDSQRREGQKLYQFSVHQELKNSCDWKQADPGLGGLSLADFLFDLAQEIQQRRIQHDLRIKQRGWNMDSLNKIELLGLLDWIEERLKLITSNRAIPRIAAVTNRPNVDQGRIKTNVAVN